MWIYRVLQYVSCWCWSDRPTTSKSVRNKETEMFYLWIICMSTRSVMTSPDKGLSLPFSLSLSLSPCLAHTHTRAQCNVSPLVYQQKPADQSQPLETQWCHWADEEMASEEFDVIRLFLSVCFFPLSCIFTTFWNINRWKRWKKNTS